MRRAVINLRDRRPVWRIPDEAAAAITRAFPPGWEVIEVRAEVDGRGDGGGVSAEALAAVRGAEVHLGFGFPRSLFLAARDTPDPALRWVHSGTAGIGAMLYPEMLGSDVMLTNSAGVHAPAMAETVIAMILHFARGLDVAVRAQQRGEWGADSFESGRWTREVDGATLGLVGLGGIGREVSRRALALGMRVVAVRRARAAGPDGVEIFSGDGALDTLLQRSDYVVLAAPATRETRAMIGARELGLMKTGAVLINVARGDLIADEDALAAALSEGRLRGAGLDVFRDEPLPSSSPLWGLPNVLITPHVSATSSRFWERETRLILENVRRYLGGEELLNLVDKVRGY